MFEEIKRNIINKLKEMKNTLSCIRPKKFISKKYMLTHKKRATMENRKR
jgi:hypothetical protein